MSDDVQIRITGTRDQVERMATNLRAFCNVTRESSDFPNLPPSPIVRRYLVIRLLQPDRSFSFSVKVGDDVSEVANLLASVTGMEGADIESEE